VTTFLLTYDRSAGRLLQQEEFSRSRDALVARFRQEAAYRDRPEVEIVALSASSEEELRRTHGRYFLGLTELIDRF
jgi:hypothetical protein